MLVISKRTRPSLGIQTKTIRIKIDKLEFFFDVLVALVVLTVLIALIVFVALIVSVALIAFIVAVIAAVIVVAVAVIMAADVVADVAAVDNSRFQMKDPMKSPCMSCRGFSL